MVKKLRLQRERDANLNMLVIHHDGWVIFYRVAWSDCYHNISVMSDIRVELQTMQRDLDIMSK